MTTDVRRALATVFHGTPEPRPVSALRHYTPRWIWPPSYRRTWEWDTLCRTIATVGLREPVVALPDGRVVDGGHRLDAAVAVGLETVPVLTLPVPLPLDDEARWAIEEWAVVNALARRQLTRGEIVRLLIDLERATARRERRRAISAANLRRGATPGQPMRLSSRVDDLARLTGLSPTYVKRVLMVARRASEALAEEVRAGRTAIRDAWQATQADLDAAMDADAPTHDALESRVARYRARLRFLVEALEALGAQLDGAPHRQQQAYLDVVARAEGRTQRNLERLTAASQWRKTIIPGGER